MKLSNQTAVLAMLIIALAVLGLAVWLPNDTVSGYLQTRRGRTTIGDAMAPGFAFALMGIAGLLTLWKAGQDNEPFLDRSHLAFLGALVLFATVSLTVMRHAGPAAAAALSEGDGYRVLRDTAPWKHVGFVLGGTFLVAALISYMEHRVSLKAVLIGVAATLALIGVFDLMFDDLLLPPNGDV